MRIGSQPPFGLGFRQRDIQTGLAERMPFKQELQRNGGFAGTRTAFGQIQMATGQAADEIRDAGFFRPNSQKRMCDGVVRTSALLTRRKVP